MAPIAATQLVNEASSSNTNEEKKLLRYMGGITTIISVLAGIAIGIAWAAGDEQLHATGVVVSDCAPCADMGSAVLKKGGSAVDAVVTTILCNGVINFHTSGLGGGGFMMIHDHINNFSKAIDFRTSAPAAAKPQSFHNQSQFEFGGLSVAVPGEIAGLYQAHKSYGRLVWKDLVSSVAKLARDGFKLTKDLHDRLMLRFGNIPNELLRRNRKLYDLLVKPGTTVFKPIGSMLKRPDYAQALDLIAVNPVAAFYTSDIMKDIVDAINKDNVSGLMTAEDVKGYKERPAEVLRSEYNGYVLETVGLPSGGLVMLHIMNVLRGYNWSQVDEDDDITYHQMIEAIKFGFAVFPDTFDMEYDDRKRMYDELLSEKYCEDVRLKITNETHNISYYDPHWNITNIHGTSAVTVIDNNEVLVSCISSINNFFGSAIMTEKFGILLNNDMDDFDKPGSVDDKLRPNPANFVKGGQRPRSAMAPVIFYNKERKCGLRGAVAGAGGKRIITATVQSLIDLLAFAMKPDTSNKKPRIHTNLVPNVVQVEENFSVEKKNLLKARGHVIQEQPRLATISIATKQDVTTSGAGDLRKNGKSTIF